MKSKNTLLMLAFFALLGLYVAKKTILKPTVRSFKSTLTDLDKNAITKLSIMPTPTASPIEIFKDGDQWKAKQGDKTVPAKSTMVEGLTKELSHLKTKQLVSKSKDKWADYEVGDAKSKKVTLYNGSKELAQLVIGKFDFKQATRSGDSYVRLANETDVYAVNGYLSLMIPKDLNALREIALVKTAKNDIEKLDMTIGTEHWVYEKDSEGHWNGEKAIDSLKMSQYLQKLSALNGKDFSDLDQPPAAQPIAKMMLHTKNDGDINVDLYPNPNQENNFIVKSNINDALFETDSSGVFKTMVTDWMEMIK